MKFDDGIPAIPLWIDGHAWFGVFENFIDIREADGTVNFRVPVCGSDEVARALASACDLQPTWSEELALRDRHVTELALLLDQFGGDFAKLVARETGKDADAARAEVARAVELLKNASCASGGGSVQAVFSQAEAPLASAVEGLVRAWTGGDAAVVVSDARAPSALFALAELSARAEFPAGALCLLHGDAATRQLLEQALGG
jgi:succinate-semialdehyde dehydrogenase/glutarate-semialdehyde dehydrogenase/malonate-semialdehyde dehydrogenase (acetylating)/methylmalonate-semialdehyde dehydrogenase